MFYDGLYYEIKGEGAPILFLHGWGGSTDSFLSITEYLAQKFMTIAVDFPGFGKSTPPPAGWCVDEYVCAIERLLTHLELSEVMVLAHSFGGRVALKLMAKGTCVSCALLCGCAGMKPRRSLRFYLRLFLFKVRKKLVKWGMLSSSVLEKRGSRDYLAASPVMRETLKRVVSEDLQKFLRNVQCPVLVVAGQGDRETPLYMSKRIARGIKKSKLVHLRGGHFAYLYDSRFRIIAREFFAMRGKNIERNSKTHL